MSITPEHLAPSTLSDPPMSSFTSNLFLTLGEGVGAEIKRYQG